MFYQVQRGLLRPVVGGWLRRYAMPYDDVGDISGVGDLPRIDYLNTSVPKIPITPEAGPGSDQVIRPMATPW